MRAFTAHLTTGLRLNVRNKMALIYGYIFPLLFLLSFWVIYRHDQVPLALHLGALLTVTALGGACFGLPTALVAERERGVWRHYRATPIGTTTLIASTITTRTILLVTAALLQLALAFALGMPAPLHPIGLIAAFLCACVAFLSIGMLIAGLANSVPAVQALGQCIFLPMLMIGGVAVPLESLPDWTLTLSAFFPGRFAVEAIQHCVTGAGIGAAARPMLVLLMMGAAAGLAAIGAFRWDPLQKLHLRQSGAWFAGAVALWLGTALWALSEPAAAPSAEPDEVLAEPEDFRIASPRPAATASPGEPEVPVQPSPSASPAGAAEQAGEVAEETQVIEAAPAETWQAVTADDIAQIAFDRLPNDAGLVTPFAAPGEEPDDLIAAQLATVRVGLASWGPGDTTDLVQRTRNYLFVAAVPDVLQMEQLERFLPAIVLERLQAEIPREELIKLLYWVAMHPQEGDDAATRQLQPLGLPEVSGPTRTARTRVMIYALKMLGRLTGDLPPAAATPTQ